MRTTWMCALALAAATTVGCRRDRSITPMSDRQTSRAAINATAIRASDLGTKPMMPTAKPAEKPMQGFVLLGTVVAEVNGTPIYGDKLLRDIEPVLKSKVTELDADKYRKFAQDEIRRQRDQMIRAELEFAAAERETDSTEKAIAQAQTEAYRDKMVSESNGSLEVLRERMRAEGYDLDQVLKEEYRTWIVRIYWERHVLPRARPSVDEIRAAYDRQKDKDFTSRASSTFSLVKVDPAAVGNPQMARERIESARQRLAGGEPFEKVAADVNQDPRLKQAGGKVGPIDKGAYRLTKVEAAVWEAPVGQLTPIVEDTNALYVAKVTDKKEGFTKPFDDPEVQKQLETEIRSVRLREIQAKANDQLARDAVIDVNDNRLTPAVEMAMQMYFANRPAGVLANP